MLRARGRGARPGRPAADAGVRDDRPGHRHEPAPVRALRLGRRAPLRPRQGDDRRELEAGRDFGRYKDVDGDGIPWRTLPGTHPSQGQLLHARHHARRVRALLRDRARLPAQRAAAERQVRHRGHAGAAAGAARRRQEDALRRHLLRHHQPGDGRGAAQPGRGRHPPRRDAAARLPVPGQRAGVHRGARRGLRRRAEPRRADAQPADQRAGGRAEPAVRGAALRRHADHRALHHPGHHAPRASARDEIHRRARST